MALNYTDKDGLLYLWQKIKASFAQKTDIPTKTSQLTNDSGYKTTDNNTTYTLTQDASDGHKVTLTPSSGTPVTITIPDKDTTYSDATTAASGLMPAADKVKVNGVATGAQVNVLETVKVNGTALSVNSKAVDITVPTNNSSLANGAGYQTAAQVNTLINTAIATRVNGTFVKVAALPATGEAGIIYLLPHSHGAKDIYDEYIWFDGAFEKIGNTDLDLSGYVLTADLVPITNAEIDAICV